MTELSPAAKAVRDAVLATYADSVPKDDNLWALERASTVAALRAAADQVVPEDELYARSCCEFTGGSARNALLAIADELEAQ